jgi:hypothetical protein
MSLRNRVLIFERVAVVASSLALACGSGSKDARSTAGTTTVADHAIAIHATAATQVSPQTPAISLDDLDDLFGIPPAERHAGALSGNDIAAYRQWVRARLHSDQLFKVVALTIADSVKFNKGPIVSRRVLEEGHSKAKGSFLYRAEPCADSELVTVKPWWDAHAAVQVCKKDYKPDQLHASDGRSCDETTNTLLDTTGCGCGPSLMFCSMDNLQDAIDDTKVSEIALTMKYIVNAGRPFGDILTTSDTVRPGLADLFYARIQFFQDGKFVPPDLAAPPALRPRPQFARAGVLTTPHYLFEDDRRKIIYDMWSDFLCVHLRGKGVDTKTLLGVFNAAGHSELRAQTNMELAHTVGCQNCHATLENLQVAYGSWQDTAMGQHIDPKLSRGDTLSVYVRDSEDLRVKGPASLEWLGSTMAQLPEFRQCMVSKVTKLVYEGQAVPDAVLGELQRRFDKTQDMGALLEGAVLARAFGRGGLGADAPPREAQR